MNDVLQKMKGLVKKVFVKLQQQKGGVFCFFKDL